MATNVRKTTTARAAVKKTVAKAANVVAKKASRQTVPKVTAERLEDYGYDEGWMTPDVKKVRSDYYAAMADAVNAAIAGAWARFKAEPTAKWAFHLHHEGLLEPLRGDSGDSGVKGALERIRYVVADKGFAELLDRFRVMRPIPQAKIVELQAATKAALAAQAESPAPVVEAPRRILRSDVDELDKVVAAKRRAVEALNPRIASDAARVKAEDAWSRFHVVSNAGYYGHSYRIGTEAALKDLLKYAQEWWDAAHVEPDLAAVAAAKAELSAAEKERSALNNEYYKQESARERARRDAERARNSGLYHDTSQPENVTEDQIWALHAELCEPDCPYTKTHKSVIPAKRKK